MSTAPPPHWLARRSLHSVTARQFVFLHIWQNAYLRASDSQLSQMSPLIFSPSQSPPPDQHWWVVVSAEQGGQLYGPFPSAFAPLPATAQPSESVPLHALRLEKQQHAGLPWSEFTDGEGNCVSLSLRVSARHPELAGHFDLLSDLASAPEAGLSSEIRHHTALAREQLLLSWGIASVKA